MKQVIRPLEVAGVVLKKPRNTQAEVRRTKSSVAKYHNSTRLQARSRITLQRQRQAERLAAITAKREKARENARPVSATVEGVE
jgi:hypothetical protein